MYELHCGEQYSGVKAQFYSTIHPRGIDKDDQLRKEQHVKRIDYWQYIRQKLNF